MALSLPLKRTISLLMLINAPAVVSALVVIVLLCMFLVAATDVADTDLDVDIEPLVIAHVVARSTMLVMCFAVHVVNSRKCYTSVVEADYR